MRWALEDAGEFLLLRVFMWADGIRQRDSAHPPDRIVARLSLADYRALLAGVPRPSREQREAFALFVSTAHSWFKHLPTAARRLDDLLPRPGRRHPRLVKRGRVREVERVEPGFHYSWRPTSEYRERFGHAAYGKHAGTSVSRIGAFTSAIASDDEPLIFDPDRAELVALPDAVAEAGEASLSGIVHGYASRPVYWQPHVRDLDASSGVWPVESGGATAFQELVERVRLLHSDPALHNPYHPDDVLDRVLVPERERQLRGVVAALDRVVALVD
jgi:hypothetical protein